MQTELAGGTVAFGDPSAPPPDWRKELPPDQDDNDELSPEERAALIGQLGFDPSDDEPVLTKALCKPGQTAAETGCTPADGHAAKFPKTLQAHQLPSKPHFMGSAAQIQANQTAANELEQLAMAGDMQALMAHPGTPSPKVQDYKYDLAVKVQQAYINEEMTKPWTSEWAQQKIAGYEKLAAAGDLTKLRSAFLDDMHFVHTNAQMQSPIEEAAYGHIPLVDAVALKDAYAKLTGKKPKKHEGQPCQPGETNEETGCVPTPPKLAQAPKDSIVKTGPSEPGAAAKPKPAALVLPPRPHFISSNKANVAQNEKAVAELIDLAQKGDAAGLAAHPGTGSPKVADFKKKLQAALAKAGANATPTAPVAPPKPATPAPPAAKPKPAAPAPVPTGKMTAEAVAQGTGYSLDQLRQHLAPAALADPANKETAEVRARVAGYLLESQTAPHNAVLAALDSIDPEAVRNRVTSMTTGDPSESILQFAQTPLYDLAVLSGMNQEDKPAYGEATCTQATRFLNFGTTTRPGSYRHELGHAIRFAWSGKHAPYGKTPMTDAVDHEYELAQQRMAANPAGVETKLSHEFYETTYGAVGQRSLDNKEELAAEHYRLYHRELYRDRHEGGNGKWLAQYRQRHPGWARLWDAHYGASLLGQQLNGSNK